MAKYRVLEPFAYARKTGEPSNGLGIRREVVRHDAGEIIELDDVVAAKFPRKLELHLEPVKPAARPRLVRRQPKPEPEQPPAPTVERLSDSEREADMNAAQARAETNDGGSGGDE